MKSLVLLIFAFISLNCSRAHFTGQQTKALLDLVESTEDMTDSMTEDNDDDGSDDVVTEDSTTDSSDDADDELYCPRYDLVVKSSDSNTPRLNYKFTFNGEVRQLSTQGNIHVQFLKDGTNKYTQCSRNFSNTAFSTNLKPLKALELLTGEITITHDRVCTLQLPLRSTTLQVIDAANGNVLWDEQNIKTSIGFCEFGYSSEGQLLRSQIVDLADQISQNIADACTK